MARRYFSVADGTALIDLRRATLRTAIERLAVEHDLDDLAETYHERYTALTGTPPDARAWPSLVERAWRVIHMDVLRDTP